MGYRRIAREVIKEADIVIEVADARFPEKSRNREMEETVKRMRKKLVIVFGKSDLVSKREAEKAKSFAGQTSIFVSAKTRKGISRIKTIIGSMAKGNEVKVAIIGYPNTGKSSLINALKGRRAAGTSSTAGFTRGKQNIKIGKIMLIDTPGVIPLKENDQLLMAMLSSKNPNQLKDLEGIGIELAELLIKNQKQDIEKFYGVTAKEGEEFLEKLAEKKNRVLKGNKPDTKWAARQLITDFQQGKIKTKL